MKEIGLFSVVLTLFFAPLSSATLNSKLFPVFENHTANVEFWRKVYGEYATNEGILHDKHHLSIIYKVIKLADRSIPNSRKINRKRIKKAKEDVSRILKHLASGNSPANTEERRIASLFGENATPGQYRAASKNLRVQTGTRDRFAQGVIRSGRYLAEMQKIFRSYDLPTDLTYLPHVESSFNISAYSKSGAAGVWQFTRGTGKLFMNIGYTIDERRDPILATHAAAKLLKKNYAELGTWPLAITAYNHGLAGMKRAKSRHGSYPKVFESYKSRSFKFASRNFYSEFIAAYDVATNYQQYFGQLKLNKPTQYHIFKLPGYLPVKTLEEKLGLSAHTIFQQNPAFRNPIFTGQKYIPKHYPLRLPSSVNIAKIDHLIPENLYHAKQKPSRFHMVRKGETVSGIAKLHGVRVRDLILANNLDRKATIYPRQNLRIPGRDKESRKPGTNITARTTLPEPKPSQVKKKKEPQKKPDLVAQTASPGQTTQPVASHEISLSEKKGTLPYSEAGVSDRLIGPDPATARPNNELTTEVPINKEVVTGHLLVINLKKHRNIEVGTIEVAIEETLGHYADWLKVNTRTIRKLNGFKHGQKIHAHQHLKIPLNKVSKAEFEEKRYEYHKENEEDFFESYRVEGIKSYQVKPGDNLWKLSQSVFDAPLWLISKLNEDVDLNKLRPSQTLKIPLIEPRISDTASNI